MPTPAERVAGTWFMRAFRYSLPGAVDSPIPSRDHPASNTPIMHLLHTTKGLTFQYLQGVLRQRPNFAEERDAEGNNILQAACQVPSPPGAIFCLCTHMPANAWEYRNSASTWLTVTEIATQVGGCVLGTLGWFFYYPPSNFDWIKEVIRSDSTLRVISAMLSVTEILLPALPETPERPSVDGGNIQLMQDFVEMFQEAVDQSTPHFEYC